MTDADSGVLPDSTRTRFETRADRGRRPDPHLQPTSAEVTEPTLRRTMLDPQLKSYAFVMPETALAAARAADADIARGHYEVSCTAYRLA
ncbi:hypothetical protein ACQKB2_18125 [Mycobacterium tuberculosis]